jgi:lysophospholipase L1-like esterase
VRGKQSGLSLKPFVAALLAFFSAPAIAADPAQPDPPGIGMIDDPCPKTREGLWALSDYVLKNDWAWMCRYREENKAYDAKHPAKVVFLGDSITEGWSKIDPAYFSDGYVGRGLGGQTSPQILLRFYQDVVALHPQAVHIMIGTNDIAGNTGPNDVRAYQDNIRAMADLAKANGIKLILASILPADRFSWKPELKPAPRIAKLNAWLRDFAKANGHVYADYFSALAGPNGELLEKYGKDGVHPEAAGYDVMKPIADAAIRKAVGKKRR